MSSFCSNAITIMSMVIFKETAPKYRPLTKEKVGKKLIKGKQTPKVRKKKEAGDLQNHPASSNKPS